MFDVIKLKLKLKPWITSRTPIPGILMVRLSLLWRTMTILTSLSLGWMKNRKMLIKTLPNAGALSLEC